MLLRAYNLALQMALRTKVLKVDCDTRLVRKFVLKHKLSNDDFYAGDWRALRKPASEKLYVNGLLLARRDDLLSSGAYDERITTYGWDDSDLTERMSPTRELRRFDYGLVSHIAHSASLCVSTQGLHFLLIPGHPLAASLKIKRHRLILTRLNLLHWRSKFARTV